MNRIIFVEKRQSFDVEAKALLNDFRENLQLSNLVNVRLLNKYTIGEVDETVYEKSLNTIFSEPMVDELFEERFSMNENEVAFGVEFLPGQYDQRADSAEQCFQMLSTENKVQIKSAKVIVLEGKLEKSDIEKIKSYYINPVDSCEVEPLSKELFTSYETPSMVQVLDGFKDLTEEEIANLHKELGLAMTVNDLKLIRDHFKSEGRNPFITEIKVIDTYWSDHCRHTTFLTKINDIQIEEGLFNSPIQKSLKSYLETREFVYTEDRDITLMDMAVISMKELKRRGTLTDLDESDEINACSIKVKITTSNGVEDYLVMFKNETHNHPTEIEPFGGAATCLGGAIRDPLSGRTYVYQAMRVTGSGDPTVALEKTLKGKLPQRKITLGAAHGYSSYGNQIGLATGQVAEVYDDGYIAKRMEIGAVIAAAPAKNVKRIKPEAGDVVVLLGGRTGRDGCGGATGSSKEHTEDSILSCGAEVQKGNPPTERKIQRLFRNEEAASMIKKCNDFGAGGISVAIGELADGLDIDLDMAPKKYEGLDGTELAISESQERMAVVLNKEDVNRFIELSNEENLEAVAVAKVTDLARMRMFWRGEVIVDLKRSFLDTNGAKQFTDITVKAPSEVGFFNKEVKVTNLKEEWIKTVTDLNVASQRGLVERFDSTIGSGTVLMPFGGKYSLTPADAMACKIPVLNGECEEATIMSYGYNPKLSKWSPYHGAYYAIIESVTKIVATGGKYNKVRLTLQEYFEKLGQDRARWGKPFSALLGAFQAQKDLQIPAIGGKDSMSGSFGDMDVPPTLVSFAVAVDKAKNVISPEFKNVDSNIIYVETKINKDGSLDVESFKNNLETIERLIEEGKVVSAYSVKNGGIAEAITKMTFGNKIGAKVQNLTNEDLFKVNYGSLIVEVVSGVDYALELAKANYKEIGTTTEEKVITVNDVVLDIEELITLWEKPLSKVFKAEAKAKESILEEKLFNGVGKTSPIIKVAKPKVLIPVFPGTNCEYDCERAFRTAGGEAKQFVINNLSKEAFADSIKELEEEIRKSQIIMLPGGFSAGDEPDGSGKFIATIFRNERIKEAVNDLLKNKDGLMIGICNGFQALVKLGLVPYGEIVDMEEGMATLTYNEIGRHMSSMVRTKVVSKLSPWLQGADLGSIHNIPISHGEGRFVAPESLIKELVKNGQIATQYVDFDGNVTMDMPFNPNGSMNAIEGITSPDGRVLGKMGHSERIGKNLYKNILGENDQRLFESGIKYFK